jgi:hypothetical protein
MGQIAKMKKEMCGTHALSFGSWDFLRAWNVHGHVWI